MDERNSVAFEDWQIEAFVGRKSDFYKERWDRKSKVNWAGVFFSGLWLLHRRMYKESIITMSGFLVVGIIFEYVFAIDIWNPLGLGLAVGIGIGGNDLYRSKLARTLKESNGMDQNSQEIYLSLQGGVSPVWQTILFFLLYVVFSIGLFVIAEWILFF